MTTDKRNGVPTLRAAAEAVIAEAARLPYVADPRLPILVAIDDLDRALRTDRDLSARRTRRRRGTDVHAPVTPTPERGRRYLPAPLDIVDDRTDEQKREDGDV